MPDWGALFSIGVQPLELVVRGTAMYWFLFLLFQHGLDSLEQVKTAIMENDGQISVIRRDGASTPDPAARKQPPGP